MNPVKARSKKFWLILLIAVITLFIFGNSAMDWEPSHNLSGAVTNALSDNEDKNNEVIVRKMAHVVEFAALGAALMGFVLCAKRGNFKRNIGFAALYFLGVALTDEFIQSFFERTSSLKDVALDVCGAVAGFGAVFLVYYLLIRRNRARISRRKKASR